MRGWRVALAALFLAAGCVAGQPVLPATPVPSVELPFPGVDPMAGAILRQYAHVPAGPTRHSPVAVGNLRDVPWSQYLEVSRRVGLDFGALEGSAGELLITPLAAPEPDAALVVLLVEGRPVGAWISPGGTSSGVLPANARP